MQQQGLRPAPGGPAASGMYAHRFLLPTFPPTQTNFWLAPSTVLGTIRLRLPLAKHLQHYGRKRCGCIADISRNAAFSVSTSQILIIDLPSNC
ncbi:hypothetical protein K440DRAFT_386026 [Wilcoxina mikolae CBS 423.85]|nr:hypothetical protein K440DRAFT_386026 [Wilcoxina mikolae CBS 423.85]